jgi:hypothetical protein
MSKNPFLFVLSAFLFVSASVGASSAYAADSGEGLQFCFLEDKEFNYPRLNFSQKTENDSRAATEVCFDKWYEANPTGSEPADASTYLNKWLSAKQGAIAFVRVTSDIKFAGRSNIGCAEGNNAFNGKMITLYSFQTLYSQIDPQTNEPYVISGLCHFGNVQIVAFIEKFSGTMYNMNFDDIYFNAAATNSSAGIIAEGVTGLDGTRVFNGYIHDVKVSNSEFQGTNVGAIVGKGNTDISSAELHSVKIVGNSNTNSYVGGIIGDNTVRCLHADQGNVHPCSNAKNNGKSAGPFVLENVDIFGYIVTGQQSYVGGIAGSITLNVQQEYHDISINGLRMNGSTYAGGLFGQVFYDGSDDASLGSAAVEHKLLIHDVSIEHGSFPIVGGSGDENGFIKAGLRAGGLIGYCDVGNNANNTDGADVEIYNVDNKIEVRIDNENNISAGGIIGNLMNSSSNENCNLSIYKTITEGDVIGGSDSYKMGYLVGEMVTSKINLKQITDNTHYGANDYVAAKGIGSIDPANWLNPPAPINATGTGLVVKRNFRNEVNGESAQTSLVADGSLKSGSDGYYIEDATTSDKYANGILKTVVLNQYQNNTGSSEEYLFCVKISADDEYLYLKQISSSETAPEGYTCYDYWYDRSGQHDQIAAGIFDDASSRIQYWLDSRNDKKTAHVVVESDLHFAGRNVDGTCKTAKNEFNQLLTFSRHYQSNYSYTKGDYTIQGVGASDDGYRVISGLCYVTDGDTSAGFFRRFEGDMSKLAFDNAYFKTTKSNDHTGAGIIASGFGSASIKVTNSEFYGLAAGAVFGRGGGELTNVVVEDVKVNGEKYAGGLIGYWDYTFKQNVQIELAKVEADIEVSGTSPIYAGALIGYLGNYGSTNRSIKIENTYSKGNVKGASGATLGYLIGAFNQEDIFEFDIEKNYHYGTDDESVKLGIGTFSSGEWAKPSTSTTSTIKNGVILRNFRNAIDGKINAAGTLTAWYYPFSTSSSNGAVLDEQMKSRRMAAILGDAWSQVDGVNDGLPIFAGSVSNSDPIKRVSFSMFNWFLDLADSAHKKILLDSIDAGLRFYEGRWDNNSSINLYTNSKGYLDQGDVDFVNSLLDDCSSWNVYNSTTLFSWRNANVTKSCGEVTQKKISTTEQYTDHVTYNYETIRKVKYFCFANDPDNAYNVFFHQVSVVASETPSDEYCYEYWYKENSQNEVNTANYPTDHVFPDAYNEAQYWLGSGQKKITLTSNIDFAGKTDGVCNDAPNAFKGKYLELDENDVFKSADNERYTISELCHVDAAADVGFVKMANQKGVLTNVSFDKVFFNGKRAGLILVDLTSADEGDITFITVKNSKFIGSEFAGAIAGFAEGVRNIRNVILEKDTVISEKTAGGAFGWIYAQYNSYDLYVGGLLAYDVTVVSRNDDFAGGLIGKISIGRAGASLGCIAFDGSVEGYKAGGLVGLIEDYSGQDGTNLSVWQNYVIGDVKFSNVGGFLIAEVYWDDDYNNQYLFNVKDNYHYSENDVTAPIGMLGGTKVENWKNFDASAYADGSVFSYNFRNAVDNLEADGDLRYAIKPVYTATESYSNGVIPSEQMKSRRMAAVLNMDATSLYWTLVDEENDGLPIFKGSTSAASKPVYAISFDYATFNTFADETSKKILNDAIEDGSRVLEYIPQYPDGGIVLFTDVDGRLDPDDVAFVKSLMGEDGLWYDASYPKLDADQVYSYNIAYIPTVYTYKKALVMNVAVHVCSDNGNSGCLDGSEVLVPKEGATWNGYSIDFNGVPMTEYTFNYMGGGYPTLVMSDFSSHLYMLRSPDFYQINSKNAIQSSIHKAVLYNFEELLDGLTDNEKSDLESGTVYNDTIHLYYVFGNTAPEYKFPVENKGTSPVVVKSFLENANGMGRKQVYETVIDANETVNVPFMRTTVAPTDLGYSLEWNAEFGLGSVFSGTHDVISTENDYITSAEDFYKNGQTKSWMVTGASGKPLTVKDSVYMDSIVTAISTTSLANNLSYLKMVITPTVTQLHYDLVFAIPEDMRDADIYVSNKKNKSTNKLELDWFDKLDDVTAENVKAPKLLNSDGCLINWKLDGSSLTHEVLDIQQELQYLTSKEENSLAVNTLVPDIDNPACPSANVTVDKHTIQLNRDGDGDLFVVQKLPYPSATTQGAIDTIVLKHSFKKDANDKYYLDVPVARDADGSELGIKLSFKANAKDGNLFRSLLYDDMTGVAANFVPLLEGENIDMKSNLKMKVEFIELVPVYVTYDLSLTSAADSAKTYLPVDASSTATLEMEKAEDEIEMWSPYRTDKCFAGWSNVKADVFTDTDPLWVSLNSSNYADFSNDQDHPTALYAIWRECPITLPMRAIALKSGLEHATLVVYQPFGKDSLRHVITDESVALAGIAFDFYVDDVRTKAEAGYSLDNTSFKVSYLDPATSESVEVTPSEGAWRLKPETLPQTTVYSFTAKVTKDEYKLVFNDNSSGEAYFGDSWTPLMTKESFAEDEDTKNWNVSVNYNVESANTEFPFALYRKGLCMNGYTFDVDDDANGVYTELNEPFIEKFKELGKDLKKPVKLYANWSQCQTPGVEVELADADKGSYTFTRKFDLGEGEEAERSYTFDSDKMFVPSEMGDISFTGVSFTIKSGAGVVLDASAGIGYRTGSEWSDWTGSLLTIKPDMEAIRLSLLKSSYEFVYDMNAPEDAMVFVNPAIKEHESYELNRSTESKDLQSLDVLGRTDACLVGWALDANGENMLEAFNLDALRTLDAFEKARKSTETLYAVWKEKGDACTPKTFKVASGWSAEEGVFTISYRYEDKTYSFEVTEDGVEIPAVAGVEIGVSFAGSNAYQFDNVIAGRDIAGNLLFSIDNGGFFTVSDAQSDVQLSTGAIPTEFAFVFNANVGDANVFAGTEFAHQVPGMFYAYNQELPMDLYRADAELVGWAFKSDVGENDFVWQSINDRFIEEYEKFVMQYGASFGTDTLYAVWKKKSMKTYTVTADSANKGTLTFTQNVGDTVFSIVVPKTGLKVPATDDIEVTAHFDVINSWTLDEGLPLVWTNAKGKKESTANDVTRPITGDVKITALATFKEIHLVFDIPSDKGLFYGDDWSKQGDFDSDDGKLSFPTLVYDTDRCLAGWSIQSESGSAWTDLNERLVDSLYKVYPTMNDLSNIKLYARWTTNVEECAGNITKATVEMEHGDVQLVEKKDKSTLVHKFNKNGTMMLPAELDGKNWTLKAIPDSSYTLDSLVVMNGKKVDTVLYDGDKLPKNMKNATLKAYFGKANKTPVEIVNKHFSQSGNTICVNIKASEFEVTRGVSAKVELIDVAKDAVVVDTVLTDSAAMAFSDEITLRMLQPGKYKVRVVIGDEKETDEYSQEFTVDSQVASLKAERWQMVSLTAVDTSLIQWNEGISFYWWDETRVGDFWQYHAYKQGDEIDASRGVWVSSKHEGSLVMRNDFEDDGKDIAWNLDSVTTGWNLVANPHGWYVDLFSMNESARKNVDEESEITFWQYDSEKGEYKETRYLAPYEAAWVKVSKKTKWKVSAEPVYVIHSVDASKIDTVRLDYQKPDENANNSGKSNAKSALAKSSTSDRWTLQAILSDKNGKRDSWNILGVGNNPFVADEPPTSMGDHVNLSIVEGKRSLAKSIKSASDETEWTLELSASDAREGYLTLEGIDGVKSLGYHVYVTIDGVTTEMQEGKKLQVSLNSSSKKATVRVARSARVVAKNVIKGLRSSQLGNQLHVSFDAPESLAGERTKVELLDVKGKLWATESAKAVFGTNAVSMKLPKQGVYILRVRVGSQQQSQRILVK